MASPATTDVKGGVFPDPSADAEAKASQMLDFLDTIGRLKTLERTGWVRAKIDRPETVASHMYRMAVMSACVDNTTASSDGASLPPLNLQHCTLMAIAHDMGEALVGDITPHDGVSNQDKFCREETAMKHIRDVLLGGNEFGHLFYNLWLEYEAQETPESQLVKQFDKLEMIVQAYEYEREQGPPGRLEQFFASTVDKEGTFTHPQVVAMVKELVSRRTALFDKKA